VAEHLLHHVLDELVPHFADRLQPAEDQRRLGRRRNKNARHHQDDDAHKEVRIGEADLVAADMERSGDIKNLKLMDRVNSLRHDQSSSSSS
jgi:hypothetical protein